ncbi:MAG: MMPL family transporter [Deltaproteobacteria bacterium]|nr:MMPL family transporter [Deltaproteobacteria bacterium]
MFLALVATAALWGYATQLRLRSDLKELLPRESAEYQAYEKQATRAPTGATILVLARSQDTVANAKFIDDLAAELHKRQKDLRGGIQVIDANNLAAHEFFGKHKWLYAPLPTIEDADAEVGRAIAIKSGLVEDLQTKDDSKPRSTAEIIAELRRRRAQADAALAKLDPFPNGRYESDGGRVVGLRIITAFGGVGDGGESLFREVQQITAHVQGAAVGHLAVGFAGDIPNAIAEKHSVSHDAIWATATAVFLVLLGLVLFFRSLFSVVIVLMPVALGTGVAYAFATAVFGYVNTAGAFLGAIIMGNGINYPMVLLARYQDFRSRHMSVAEALRLAVKNAFRAELVGAAVAAIAYGSLTVTAFRGFNQFGAIGFVGMISVWLVSIPLVPALVAWGHVWLDRTQPLPGSARFASMGVWLRAHAKAVAVMALVVTAILALPLFHWLQDPWEYNFARLGSRHNKAAGAGHWSQLAEQVFGGKARLAGALLVADSREQVPAIAHAIMQRDNTLPGVHMIDRVFTLADVLPGTPAEQAQKLRVLQRLQRRLKPHIMDGLPPELQAEIRSMMPPSDLKPVAEADLPPDLLRLFTERNGTLGTVFYVQTRPEVSLSDGRNLLRIDAVTNNVRLADGTTVQTASRAGVFAEIFRSLRRDGPLASFVSLAAVVVVLLVATHNFVGALSVLFVLLTAVVWMLGVSAWTHERLNFLNFVALPITFGIGCEYPFNIYDRVRLLGGDIAQALARSGGAVALCSYTTIVGYGSLLLSDNQALRSFGRLAVVGEFTCLIGALLLLPAVLGLATSRMGSLLVRKTS